MTRSARSAPSASSGPPADPEAVVIAALEARDRWQWERVVACADPASVAEFYEGYLQLARPHTLEDFRRDHPEIPGEHVDAAFRSLRGATGDAEAQIPRAVRGIRSYAELQALTPAEFLARWLEAHEPRAMLVYAIRQKGHPVPAHLEAPPAGHYRALGHILEHEDLAHVLYRQVWEGGSAAQAGPLGIISVRRQANGEWRLLVDGDFLQPHDQTAYVLDDEIADLITSGDEIPQPPDRRPT